MDWNQLLSRRRLGIRHRSSAEDTQRTDFQRDFDRIVFASAFRRMQDKTQVFPLSSNDYVRTRLTHSLEVSSVARSLGNRVGEVVIARHGLTQVVPADFGAIVAAAALAHDLGNPPFGHAGEDGIRQFFEETTLGRSLIGRMHPAEQQDLLRFEGNAQGFRVVARLQSPDNFGGMQLTLATLGSFTKYPRGSLLDADPAVGGIAFKKFNYFQADAALFDEVATGLGLDPVLPGAWRRHPLAFLLEAADDICYRIVDLEDAVRLRQLEHGEVLDLLLPLVGLAADSPRLKQLTRPKERIEYLRAKAIGRLIDEVVTLFLDCEAEILAGRYGLELLDEVPSRAPMLEMKELARRRVYIGQPVVEVQVAGFEVLGGLLAAFAGAVTDVAERGGRATALNRMLMHLLPEQFVGPGHEPVADAYLRTLKIIDFISGMTDSYAVSLFKRITGMSLPMQ
ncbi:MAG TPA: deoxyguanosinetriphosphate triphosphohydrolase [Plasticicumulans sp.]|nr:deoxyguanosinetriphosphate triphosphohydrolase [Plasticicumulans sp.]HND99269.1 deoxyguanosinetriphosphate triphosphohydrolase [Plasticicumulans sp.]HNE02667.1 deoxyguanosinetriphosphate triphosphohydrolase [Plasticicumulans sp.]HNF67606.1 deoxyguanosinetriphosphate triphosphohydrolase [Plasticicumulans sp.]